MPNSVESPLVAENVSVVIDGHTIVEDISFSLPAGRTTALVGPNGAGKSVLIKAMLNVLPLSAGTVTFFGEQRVPYSHVAHRIAYLPQRFSFDTFLPLTVAELFSLASSQWLGLEPQLVERRDRMLEFVGMTSVLHSQLKTLSGGQLQRVLLAYSLMREPELLILDEPSAGVDVEGQEGLYALLERLQQERSLTILLVSHELDVVTRAASQVICLNQHLLCAGPPDQALSDTVLTQMYGAPISHYHHAHDDEHR